MQEKPSPRAGSTGALKGLIVGGLIGAVIVGAMMALAPLLDGAALAETRFVQRLAAAPDAVGAWDLLALPLLILIVLATHEIGHLVGGMSQGMRFLLLIVGPFVWQASGSGTKFEWNTSPALMGGLAAALPTAQGDLNRPGFSGDFLLKVTQPRLRTPACDDTPVRTRPEAHPRWARAGAGC